MTAPGTSPRSTPPPRAVTTGSWRAQAACRDHPRLKPSAWDDSPGPGHRETAETRAKRIAAAKAVCRKECPVREACLADVDLFYDEGVRGGEDLRDVRAAARRAAKRTALADFARAAAGQ